MASIDQLQLAGMLSLTWTHALNASLRYQCTTSSHATSTRTGLYYWWAEYCPM